MSKKKKELKTLGFNFVDQNDISLNGGLFFSLSLVYFITFGVKRWIFLNSNELYADAVD